MQDALFYIGIICSVLAVTFLITSVTMFFKFDVRTLWKDSRGTLQRKQIEEIRSKNSSAAGRKGKVNVFEDLEKNAKLKKGNTQSLKSNPASQQMAASSQTQSTGYDSGTMVLQNSSKAVNPDFIIEKNIMFVSTSEVI